MRPWRLALTGMIVVALLALVGGPALAQGEEGTSSATYINGSRTWVDGDDDGWYYETQMSDARASGTYTESGFAGYEYDAASMSPPTAALGKVTLVNEDGSWSGHESAVFDPEMGWVLDAWLAGEGDYAGLTLYLHATRDIYSTPEMSFEGVIFEGPVPHMLEAVILPAE